MTQKEHATTSLQLEEDMQEATSGSFRQVRGQSDPRGSVTSSSHQPQDYPAMFSQSEKDMQEAIERSYRQVRGHGSPSREDQSGDGMTHESTTTLQPGQSDRTTERLGSSDRVKRAYEKAYLDQQGGQPMCDESRHSHALKELQGKMVGLYNVKRAKKEGWTLTQLANHSHQDVGRHTAMVMMDMLNTGMAFKPADNGDLPKTNQIKAQTARPQTNRQFPFNGVLVVETHALGKHEMGLARVASQQLGAELGRAKGWLNEMGNAYGIVTQEDEIEFSPAYDVPTTFTFTGRLVELNYIQGQIDRLISVMWECPARLFFVQELGQRSGFSFQEVTKCIMECGQIPPNMVMSWPLLQMVMQKSRDIQWGKNPMRMIYQKLYGPVVDDMSQEVPQYHQRPDHRVMVTAASMSTPPERRRIRVDRRSSEQQENQHHINAEMKELERLRKERTRVQRVIQNQAEKVFKTREQPWAQLERMATRRSSQQQQQVMRSADSPARSKRRGEMSAACPDPMTDPEWEVSIQGPSSRVTRSRNKVWESGQSNGKPMQFTCMMNTVQQTSSEASPFLTDEQISRGSKSLLIGNGLMNIYSINRTAEQFGSAHIADLVGVHCECGLNYALRITVNPNSVFLGRMVANCRYSKCKSYRWLDEINKQRIEIVLKPTRNPNRDEYLKRGMDWVLQNHREKRGHHEVTPFGKQTSPQFAMASTSRQTMDAGNTPGAKVPRNSEQPGFQRVDPRTHAGGRDHADLVINSATTATPVQISHTTQTTYEQALEVERQRLEAYERAKRDHEEEEELARRKYGFSQEAQESVTQSTTMLQQEEPAPSRSGLSYVGINPLTHADGRTKISLGSGPMGKFRPEGVSMMRRPLAPSKPGGAPKIPVNDPLTVDEKLYVMEARIDMLEHDNGWLIDQVNEAKSKFETLFEQPFGGKLSAMENWVMTKYNELSQDVRLCLTKVLQNAEREEEIEEAEERESQDANAFPTAEEKPTVVPEGQGQDQVNKDKGKDASEEQQDSKNEDPRNTENPASSTRSGRVFRWVNDDEVEPVDEEDEQFFSAETNQVVDKTERAEMDLRVTAQEMTGVTQVVDQLKVEAANIKGNTDGELSANEFLNVVENLSNALSRDELGDYMDFIEGWITLAENASKEAKDIIEGGILAAAQLNLQYAEKNREFVRIRDQLREQVKIIRKKRMKDDEKEEVPSLESSSDEEDEETAPRYRKMPALNEGSVGPGELSKVRMMPAIISMATILKQEVWKDSMTVPKRTSPPLEWMQTMSALRGMVWKHDIRIEMDGEVKVMRAVLDTGGEATLIRDSRVPTNLWEDAWRVENGVLSGVGSVKFDRMIPLLLAFGTRVESALWVTALPFPSNEWPFDDCDVVIDYMTLQVMIEAVYFSDIHMIRVKPRSREDMFRVIQQLKNDDMSKSASQMFNRDYRLASLGPVE